MRPALVLAVVAASAVGTARTPVEPEVPAAALRVFEGSTPCGAAIRSSLQIPGSATADLIEWQLTLYDAPSGRSSAAYHLRYAYGPGRPGVPGLTADDPRLERRGSWTATAHPSAPHAGAIVYRLSGGLSLLKIDERIVHLLNADGSLMVGNGGWSYTLNRRNGSERRVDPALIAADSGDEPRTISPRAEGPGVFGVFEGRTPCQGIAHELGIRSRPGCWKAKWRVTLLRNPHTRQPTSYKVEGTLYGSSAREGTWHVTPGTAGDSRAVVYELSATPSHAAILLMKGDDNVLFLLDRNRRPLAGNAQHSYTLDRRS